jgi:SAM-dependent methyltransferase
MQSSAPAVLTPPARLSRIAREIFFGAPAVPRAIQSLRPYICPFDELLPYVPEGSSILDIGCGSGLFLGLLAAAGACIDGLGVDIGEAAICRAQRMAERLAGICSSARLSFRRLPPNSPLPTGSFDLVSLVDVIHHIPPRLQKKFLENALSRVKPSGLFLYKDMCRRPLWRASANRFHDLVMVGEAIHYFPVEDVETCCRQAGFQLIVSKNINRLWYGHELRVFRALAK